MEQHDTTEEETPQEATTEEGTTQEITTEEMTTEKETVPEVIPTTVSDIESSTSPEQEGKRTVILGIEDYSRIIGWILFGFGTMLMAAMAAYLKKGKNRRN